MGARVRARRPPALRPAPARRLPAERGRDAACARTSASRARRRRRTAASSSPAPRAPSSRTARATVGGGSPARILRYNLQRGVLDRQYVLLDGSDRRAAGALDAVRGQRPRRAAAAEQPVPARDGALVLGRRARHRQHDQALRGRAPRCGRRQRLRQLATLLGSIQPVEKTLLEPRRARDPARQRRGDDLRPRLPDGRRSLVLVSDNNFSPAAFTQFLLFAGPRRPRTVLDSPVVRKTVTLVFCDVADSTPLGEQLDPEALRGVWSRYHETARDVLERHGGTIEKFVGDAVLGVFGIPVVHEDDAPGRAGGGRAARGAGAAERRARGCFRRPDRRAHGRPHGRGLRRRSIAGRSFATGDAVVAQRLEATAAAGEILVGDATIRLVRTPSPSTPCRRWS